MYKLLRFPLLALVALSFTACGGGNAAVGQWEFDTDATVAGIQKTIDAQLASVPEEQKAMAQQMMGGMVEMLKQMKATMTLAADGTFEVEADMPDSGNSKIAGTWKLEGDKVTMVGKEEGKDEETKVGTLKGDSIVIEEAGGAQKMEMFFRRKN